jgi:glycosyltransferase involved in cell wall biosynthesis
MIGAMPNSLNDLSPTPEVSFVIPVLNGERDVRRCLASIQELDVRPETVEVIVMDNGSTDRTQQIVRECGRLCVVVPGVHVGALRNQGVAQARGEFVAFVDVDVELTPGWLRHGLVVFREQGVVAAGCFPGIPASATWVQEAWDAHQRRSQRTDRPFPVPWLPSMNLMVRRKDFLAIQGFDERLETAEDVDLCYRLGRRGKVVCNPAMRAVHWGEAQDLRKFWRKERWRGAGNLDGVAFHGFRWDELPSLAYPLFVLLAALFVIVGTAADLYRHRWLLGPVSATLLMAPALALAVRTASRSKRPALAFRLFLLYLIYGLARACAMLNSVVSQERHRRQT